ncbi:initiator tRNA phosphoribosyl transferase [Wilcoxina mikolae CBS 423.85]|nr:initiator tRNA phosphoribosyl transferase [Wilcoxina mikolae CBS 423.85]
MYQLPIPDSPSFEFTVFTPSTADDDSDFTTPTLPQLNNHIRRSTRSLRNRLHSIFTDSLFVAAVARAYSLPLIPNARAGDWYVPPLQRAVGGSTYFKSTDGHTNEWGFSLRRLNLGLLSIAGEHNGAILVDSTRRGKRFPDSLAKTVPIWISVLNAALFPDLFPTPILYTSPLAVSPHEAAAIEKLLPRFLREFLELGLDLAVLRGHITKPLRPLFITPASPLPSEAPQFEEFTPLVLVTASRMMKGEGTEGEYIQGAGDDHEGWASTSGLTSGIFWAHHESILAADEDGISAAVSAAVTAGVANLAGEAEGITLVKPTDNIFISSLATMTRGNLTTSVIVNCSHTPLPQATINTPIPPGKRGNKALRLAAPGLITDLTDAVAGGRNIVFICDSGDDVAPAVALILLSLYYNHDGTYLHQQRDTIDKTHIKRRLAWISTARPTANPARGLLNAVNSVLMGRED